MTTESAGPAVGGMQEGIGRLPLRGWALELARRWNSGSYSLFILHGNVFDVYAVQDGGAVSFVSLKSFLARRLFSSRTFLLFYDIGDGLTFGSSEMQKRFFEWLKIYDQVESTHYHEMGLPREFNKLTPLLRRFFWRTAEQQHESVTLVIDFAEKIVPHSTDAYAGYEERTALVTLLKWAVSTEMRGLDVGILLITESAAALHSNLLQNPHVAQIKIDLPDSADRLQLLESDTLERVLGGKAIQDTCDLNVSELAERLSGLNLLRCQQLLAEAVRNGLHVTFEYIATHKKRLIEEFCQGLVRFKNPTPGLSLASVATHHAAKQKLRELAWLIRNGKRDVLERGVLLPGRVGVGKSFLVDCFASECGLPVMEIGEFRSKWVGDTELQQARILMTIRALGPVIIVVDEADAVFGGRDAGRDDSGVSARVFAAFAAHLGDSSLRGRELWIAMTSRPDLLAIDMKRQGRFGLCIPLFPAQGPADVADLFTTVGKVKQIELEPSIVEYIRQRVGQTPLTGSDAESMLIRAKERAVLSGRDHEIQVADFREAIDSFIDPLDPHLLALQELTAVLACSDRRYLPERYRHCDRAALIEELETHKMRAR